MLCRRLAGLVSAVWGRIMRSAGAACAQLWSQPQAAEAALTLDQFVTRMEDNPTMQRGRRGPLTDAERMLLEQQDELRQLRSRRGGERTAPPAEDAKQQAAPESSQQAPTLPKEQPAAEPPAAPAPAPEAVPPPPAARGPTAEVPAPQMPRGDPAPAPAERAPMQAAEPKRESAGGEEGGGGIGGAGNLVGVVAAGVLGGFLYQSRKTNETAQLDFEGRLRSKDQARARDRGPPCGPACTHVFERHAANDSVMTTCALRMCWLQLRSIRTKMHLQKWMIPQNMRDRA